MTWWDLIYFSEISFELDKFNCWDGSYHLKHVTTLQFGDIQEVEKLAVHKIKRNDCAVQLEISKKWL